MRLIVLSSLNRIQPWNILFLKKMHHPYCDSWQLKQIFFPFNINSTYTGLIQVVGGGCEGLFLLISVILRRLKEYMSDEIFFYTSGTWMLNFQFSNNYCKYSSFLRHHEPTTATTAFIRRSSKSEALTGTLLIATRGAVSFFFFSFFYYPIMMNSRLFFFFPVI